MRELNLKQREEIMYWVRFYLADKSFCPFYFRNDFARVISGEEEAIYSWAAINFLKGDLLLESKGSGPASGGEEGTFGTLDLGGASSQIAFYVKNQDISENLFKLQIGGQKHWNVYTKSFLSFGHVSARRRHLQNIANNVLEKRQSGAAETPFAMDYCFHAGYTEMVDGIPNATSGVKRGAHEKDYDSLIPSYSTNRVEVFGPAAPAGDQFDRCLKALRPLLEKDHALFCMEVYDRECSIDGAYQPILPDDGRFIGTSSYILPWEILRLPTTASLTLYRERAESICSMSFDDVLQYYETHGLIDADSKLAEMLPYFCFLSSYVYVLLIDGYGFTKNSSLTVLDQVNGNKVGWPLGAILYEINALPWEMKEFVYREPWGKLFLAAAIGKRERDRERERTLTLNSNL
jgi:Golgi nucleoside diphosphatase